MDPTNTTAKGGPGGNSRSRGDREGGAAPHQAREGFCTVIFKLRPAVRERTGRTENRAGRRFPAEGMACPGSEDGVLQAGRGEAVQAPSPGQMLAFSSQ